MTENVYIGSKPILNYVTALVAALQRESSVNVLARGKAISSAVDVVEVCKRSFLKGALVEDINIGTEMMGDEGDLRNVSTTRIKLTKSG